MKILTYNIVNVIRVPCALMDKVRTEVNTWAQGDNDVCLTLEDALEVEELAPLLSHIQPGSDVILSAR